MLPIGPITADRLTEVDSGGVVAAYGAFTVADSRPSVGGLAVGESFGQRLQFPCRDADVTPPVGYLPGDRFVDLADRELRIFFPPTRPGLGRGTSS